MQVKDTGMNTPKLVVGLLNRSAAIGNEAVAGKYRDLTVSWSRYDYRDEIIEASSVDGILEQAAARGYRWCLVLPVGHIIAEHWTPEHWQDTGFRAVLSECIGKDDFLVSGIIRHDPAAWFGFESSCLLVNLQRYRQLSAPRFEVAADGPVEVPVVRPQRDGQRIEVLRPAGGQEQRLPSLPGWNLIATSLREGLAVPGLDPRLTAGLLDLSAENPERTAAFARYLGDGISRFDPRQPDPGLGPDQIRFLEVVQPQASRARRGVFLWNIEGYDDIETPASGFQPPLQSLYSVAAGFKPLRILYTHGFEPSTRLIYFDYSPQALKVRRYLNEHWGGVDFPQFVQQLFREFPHPETFYQLWGDATPENVEAADIRSMWQQELDRWGGPQVFQDHWQACRKLPQEYVCCNILTDPAPLLDTMAPESRSMIWFSNAFFTMYGNWFYSLEERRQMYENWIRQLAAANPQLFLYGSDYNNVNVNHMRAEEYRTAWQRAADSSLVPCRLSPAEIRM
jgi:hypothetical protein